MSRLSAAALALLVLGFLAVHSHADEAVAEPAASDETAASEEGDDTQKLLEQLTINMVADTLDVRTFMIRETSKDGNKYLRLGNVKAPEQTANIDDEQFQAKLEGAKSALDKLVKNQMIWWKAAPEAHQAIPAHEDGTPILLADVWLIDGRHVNSLLRSEGHLEHEEEYVSDHAGNILTARADEEKKDSYKKLEEALKESEKAKAEAAKEERARIKKEKEMESEPIDMAGWFGLTLLAMLVVGGGCNFGRPSNKKVNLNRKRGAFQQFLSKFKSS